MRSNHCRERFGSGVGVGWGADFGLLGAGCERAVEVLADGGLETCPALAALARKMAWQAGHFTFFPMAVSETVSRF
jgi:hypothetical protein